MLKIFSLCIVVVLQCASALAQTPTFPNRPITVIVPMGPGGTSDILIRTLAPLLSEKLGQSVVVENRPGVNGLIGEEYFSKVKPDGHTLMLGTGSSSINLWMHTLNYDPRKVFVPVTLMTTLPMALIVNNKVGAKSVKEFVDYVKKSPTPIPYGHWGDGSVSHSAAATLQNEAGLAMNGIAYKTSPQVLNDTLGGQVDASFVGIIAASQQAKSGKIQIVAVTSPTRVGVLADVPTMTEAGYPKVDIESWFGIFLPQGTPENIKNQISQAILQVLRQPDLKSKLEAQGFIVVANTPEQFGKFYLSDIEKNGRLMKAVTTNK